jgi:gas vesicle protein
MSFGGTVTRGKRAARSGEQIDGGLRRAQEEEVDWERVAVFGTGIAIGAALGAGVALLFAPFSGEETRAAIARRGARLAHRSRDAWDELRDELEWAARRGKRRVGRRVQRARWAAEDFIDERRRPNSWWRRRAERKEKERKREAPELDEAAVQEIVESMC